MNRKTEISILFGLALLLVLFKHLLIINLPIESRNYQTDDRLMVNMAAALSSGKWLGDYQAQLLMKGAFYPMFLAAVSSLKLNYLGFLNMMNVLAALFFVSQLRGLLKKPLLRFILFIVLLFDPCTFSQLSFQRVYRSSITEMEVLFLWGAYYGIYCKSLDIKKHFQIRELLIILFAGFVIWAIWNTREECFWMLPFIITATILIGFRYRKAAVEKTCSVKLAGVRAGLLLLPFLMLIIGNLIIRDLNRHYYGEAVRLEIDDGNFSDALNSIYSVKNREEIRYVTVTREKLERIMAVSPSLEQIRPELEAEFERYDRSDRHPNDGEIEDGWFYWALKYAAFKNGAADSLPKSQAFWKTVQQELEAALDAPSSSLERQAVMPSVLMSPLQRSYLEQIPEAFQKTMRYMLTYQGTIPLAGSSGKSSPGNDELFESVTNNIAVRNDEDVTSARITEKLPHFSEAMKLLMHIADLYRLVNPAAAALGLICFCIMIFLLLLKKQKELLSPILIICGMMFSMLIVAAGVCYTDISAFGAIIYHYLSGAYPLMLGSIWFSILFMVQMLMKKNV